MRFLPFTVLLLISSLVYSQSPAIDWQDTIGGDDDELHRSALTTSDGGILLGGFSKSGISGDKTEESIGFYDMWIVKLDADGNITWQNTIGGTSDDRLSAMDETTDGGYILAGYSQSNISGDKTEDSRGAEDFWIVKVDSGGVVQWDKTIGGSWQDQAMAVKQASDGGYIVGGWSSSDASGEKSEDNIGDGDYWVVKLSSNGNLEWENTIGGTNSDNLWDLTLGIDGGYVLVGWSSSNASADKTENSEGGSDFWIVKISEVGDIEWDETIGGDLFDSAESIAITSDGNYVVGGRSNSNISGDKTEPNIGNQDIWIVKIDIDGDILWQNTIGGTDEDQLQTEDGLKETSDGGFIIGGYSASNAGFDKSEDSRGGIDYWVIKTDSNGTVEWEKTIGGDGTDLSRAILIGPNERYTVVGRSDSSLSGDKTEAAIGERDYWIVSLEPTLNLNDNRLDRAVSIYPNPVLNELTFQTNGLDIDIVNILDINGRLISTFQPVDSSIDMSKLNSGIYLVEFISKNNSVIKKIIKK